MLSFLSFGRPFIKALAETDCFYPSDKGHVTAPILYKQLFFFKLQVARTKLVAFATFPRGQKFRAVSDHIFEGFKATKIFLKAKFRSYPMYS